MEENISIFDLLPTEEAEKYKPKKSTDWKWTMAEDYPKEKNGLKVFSCFACGGGSTMGYKLAGCEVLGCCEIDPKMNEVYVKNHHPKYNFLMDIREFNALPNEEIPAELFNLDILDGSPPCTTFSMAGQREESWGKKKKFREGQKEQTLDDLSFVFIETVKKLKPKTVIMENVEGLLLGEAFEYVRNIYAKMKQAGYRIHHWLLKGENMGVPQKRHRVFFFAVRNDLNIDPRELDMTFNYEPVLFGDIRTEKGRYPNRGFANIELMKHRIKTDKCIGDITFRVRGKESGFNTIIIHDEEVANTTVAGSSNMRYCDGLYLSNEDIIRCQTFPGDYDFGKENPNYVCGMSVPPIMIKRIVTRLIEQGVYDYAKSVRSMQEKGHLPRHLFPQKGLSASLEKEE